MSQTPSARRREGRNAFSPGENSDDINPYLGSKKWGMRFKVQDWRDGWRQAKEAYESEIAERETNNDDLEVVAHTLCQSGKFETGEGTCAPICMNQLGSARTPKCCHEIDVHGTLASQIVAALGDD